MRLTLFPTPRRDLLLFGALGLLFLASAAYEARHARAALEFARDPQSVAAAPVMVGRATNEIERVGGEAAGADLKPGDRLLSVAGRPYVGRADLARAGLGSVVGDPVEVRVERDGQERTVRVALAPAVLSTPALVIVLEVVTPLLCLTLGFGVAAVRRYDPRAWVLLLLMLSFAHFAAISGFEVRAWEPGLRDAGLFFHSLLRGLWPPAMLMFGVVFPERAEWDRKRPWLKWLVIGPAIAGAVTESTFATIEATDYAAALPLNRWIEPAMPALIVVNMLAVGLFFASMGYRLGTARAPDSRRRLALLLYGAGIGLTPIWLIVLLGLFGAGRILSPWLIVTAILLLALFPVTLAYVIVVERAMDVRVILRQGLQYALAQRAVLALQVGVFGAVAVLALRMASDASLRQVDRLSTLAVGVLFVVLARRVAVALRTFLDRRFFREAVSAEHVLHDLSDEVRMIVETRTLLDTVARRVSAALHVPRLATLLAQEDAFAVVHAFGSEVRPEARFARDGPTAERLRREGTAVRVYPEDPHSWVNREEAAAERPALTALHAELLLPLRIKQELLGFLSLGPKLSEEPYSPSDVRLLSLVAAQTALALENGRLTTRIAVEVARAARLDREIEIAREVQEGLFPQEYPPIDGLDFAGYCRPAAGVGGDYYDFVSPRPGVLGIAIGDVAGKGIPAALLMAGLQASLRSHASATAADLPGLMNGINRLLCEASPANRYATFFYGEYEADGGRLRYVNAGHNAPFLIRTDGAVERLSDGGPVVGLIPSAAYSTFETVLRPGDRLVGFTDGISEAMDGADNEWGEERLLEVIRACDGLTARDTIDAVLRAADTFVAGAKQHDDMTLVGVRAFDSGPLSREHPTPSIAS